MTMLLAHCGSNWKYCDGGSVLGLVLLVLIVRSSLRRADRKARERFEKRAEERRAKQTE